MNVIFLDIDGVLATLKTDYSYFEPACLKRLNKIVRAIDAHIVVSSTWRIGSSLTNLQTKFDRDPYLKQRVIGMTPVFPRKEDRKPLEPFGRGLEISAWLNDNEVEKHIVIDDDSFDIEPHLEFLICTDAYLGLQDKDVAPAIALLNETTT